MTPQQMADLHATAFDPGWSASSFAGFRADPRCITICREAGFALARHVLDEAELLTLVVAPDARQRGMGRDLLEDLMRALREAGIARLLLEVATDNAPARALYRSAGFREDGRRAGYYARPGAAVDAFLMSRSL